MQSCQRLHRGPRPGSSLCNCSLASGACAHVYTCAPGGKWPVWGALSLSEFWGGAFISPGARGLTHGTEELCLCSLARRLHQR